MTRTTRIIILSLAFAFAAVPSLRATQCYVTGFGSAQIGATISFPGDPICGPGSFTNNLSWVADYTGQASCPLYVDPSTQQFKFSYAIFTGTKTGGGAGCWYGAGPRVFSSGVDSTCPPGSPTTAICERYTITTLGQWVGVPVPGVYLAGPTYVVGYAWCTPRSMTATITCTGSPIMIDTLEQGFHLTDLEHGVRFRETQEGHLMQMSWTDQSYSNGWLALDRDHNGTIDSLQELFGNFTPQPPSENPNGYDALAVYDDPANGGNGNGVIDPGDSIWPDLRIWIDANHNGVSEPNELHTLDELSISKVGISYTETQWVDQYGNRFRYRGKIWDEQGNEKEATYDVFLLTSK